MGKWQLKMKRSHLIRLQGSDVFSVPKSLGLKAQRQNSIMCVGLELNGLHPLSCHFAQNTIVETPVFTDWVQKVLKINGALPRRGSWNESIRNLERDMSEWFTSILWCYNIVITYNSGMDNTTILKGQNPIQTKFGALYYENPYRGESTCLFCDGSCEYIRGIKHGLQYLSDYIEQKKS